MHVIGSRAEGGAERLYLRLTAALARQGQEVLCVLRPSSVLTGRLAPGLRCELVRMRSVFDPFARARIGAVAKAFGARVVHTYMGRATRLTRLNGRDASGLLHVARVGGYHDVKPIRHAHAWIASTAGIRAHLVEQGLPEERVFHIPHLVEPALAPDVETLARLRAELALTPDAVIILCMGRLHRDRGIDVMLEALGRLPARVQDRPVNLLVVGDGPQREPLRRLADELGVAERVRWVADDPTTQTYMGLADLFAYPSRESAVGTGILEAWNHGVPVIATRTVGPAELVEHGRTGILVPPQDAAALADAALALLHAPAGTREAMAAAALARVAREHGAQPVVSRYLDLYSKLLPDAG